MKIPLFLAVGLLAIASAFPVQAATIYKYTYDGTGLVPAGMDVWNKPVVNGGDGFFRSDIAANDPDLESRYSQFNLYMDVLFERAVGHSVTLDEIASITYSTRSDTPGVGADWAIRIYTAPTQTSPKDWYNLRFDARNPKATDSNWASWDMNSIFSGTNKWFSNMNDGSKNTGLNLSLAEISSTYGTEAVKMISLYVGSSSNQLQMQNEVANIKIVLKNGDEVQVNMIPEPTGFVFCAAGGFAYALFRRRRLR